jgi:hypothetical protein
MFYTILDAARPGLYPHAIQERTPQISSICGEGMHIHMARKLSIFCFRFQIVKIWISMSFNFCIYLKRDSTSLYLLLSVGGGLYSYWVNIFKYYTTIHLCRSTETQYLSLWWLLHLLFVNAQTQCTFFYRFYSLSVKIYCF